MPQLNVIAGPNGSGKSTLISKLLAEGIALGEYLNADDIAANLTGPPDEIAREAQQIVRDRRIAALREGRDHSFETVMSHVSHIDYMHEARLAGFEVRLFFVATEDPVINLGRVDNRVTHGGHGVPADRVVARYHRSIGNLPAAMLASDQCRIFDNSSADRPLRRLADAIRFGEILWLEHDWNMWDSLEALKAITLATWPNVELAPNELGLNEWIAEACARMQVWWLEILLQLRPNAPFEDGPLP